MKFIEQNIPGVFLIELDLIKDERGVFARVWDEEEFKRRGLFSRIVHANISGNPHTGTLRGLHYQVAPHEEAKIVQCSRGAIFDVALDLRPKSRTFKKWCSVELSADTPHMFYIPQGVAHGFQTLEDNSEVLYFMSEAYYPESARGVRWDDPAFAIKWPAAKRRIISKKDSSYLDFQI
ncbi:dTDP-4-dehydrorhamnose 3,5-epimerase [Candidatus Kaiserbacteria bacterium]|nr:dTDP-4-dehydrorhamnose 3,5-epimerase [Candidatus Kaiserbacteria bacterium]